MTAIWAGPKYAATLLHPSPNDCHELRRKLDDMQAKGLDFVVIERWRALLDAYVSGEELRAQVEDTSSDLESAIDDLGIDPAEHRIDIGGALDDLEAEPGALSAPARKVIDQAIDNACKAAELELSKKWSEVIDELRGLVKKLDEAIGKDADLSEPDRAERKAQAAKAAKATLAKEIAKRAPKRPRS